MRIAAGRFTVKLAETQAEVAAAQRLRYRVFVEEKGARADAEERNARREQDRYDPHCDHLLLLDAETANPDVEEQVVGVYRLMRGDQAGAGIGFYGETEYDLAPLRAWPRPVLELGRSCVDREYRRGAGMHLLWSGLAQYVADNDIEILFGVASFHGTDPAAIADALSNLHYAHLAPEDLRVRALEASHVPMNILPPDKIDTARALRQTPALIKAYLRLGGFVGEGAYVDHDFNTIDVCLLMDTTRMVDRYRTFYARQKGALDTVLG